MLCGMHQTFKIINYVKKNERQTQNTVKALNLLYEFTIHGNPTADRDY